jgi:hypothetical protein
MIEAAPLKWERAMIFSKYPLKSFGEEEEKFLEPFLGLVGTEGFEPSTTSTPC